MRKKLLVLQICNFVPNVYIYKISKSSLNFVCFGSQAPIDGKIYVLTMAYKGLGNLTSRTSFVKQMHDDFNDYFSYRLSK